VLFLKLKEILAIKALQTKQDLCTSFKEVISVNCGIYCNTSGSMTHQFLQSLHVKKVQPWSGQELKDQVV